MFRLINSLRLVEVDVEAMSPYDGEIPDPIVYNEPDDVVGCTVRAVERCLRRGFGIDDIAVISMRGRERSLVQGLERLGRWLLHRFTGRFDEGGAAIWAEGELLIGSVRRFKGQAAGAIVLSDCDLAAGGSCSSP